MVPDIEIEWHGVEFNPPSIVTKAAAFLQGEEALPEPIEEDEDLWNLKRVLYAYCDPDDGEIFYIGKAWSNSTWSRFIAKDKENLWDECGVPRDEAEVYVGCLELEKGKRLTKDLLAVVESLLIYQIEPDGNIQSVSSGKGQLRLSVRCNGEWQHHTRWFVDE